MDDQAAIAAILQRLREELPPSLTYHSLAHTLDVLDRVATLGAAENVREEELRLLRVAAAYHDAGFLINNRDHERLGCKLVRMELPPLGFSPAGVKAICGMIRATKVPQAPTNRLEAILCDADLDYLGRADFYPIGHLLFQELKTFRIIETEEAWNQLQIKFLRNHSYWTATNQQLREAEKQKRLTELIEKWGDPPL